MSKVRVFIRKELASLTKIERVAVGLALFEQSGRDYYPSFFGHYGKFENNPRAEDLSKLHIASIADLTSSQWQSKRGYQRKSDHFVVYCRHWYERNYFQILDIVTPNAHNRIDSLIVDLLNKAEQFNAMSKTEIDNLTQYTADHLLAEEITLTE